PEAAPEAAPAADLPPVPQAVKAPAPRPALEARPKTHLVKKGETLFAIATRYGLEVDRLRKWNKIKGNRIQNGQRLRLGP
ncbi:MAG: LysM peptidoglycan-binding domain-containing protein, partial [Holophaga sp.]|nr:LysM peptidoglycan-binding domain-containing protein [Holophaga sp.]